ncbi:MAG: hypothetical protein RL462_548 [Pseudomonadota bacterium]|jgi:predicted TIM-barrel fold metal-dependent hydrolase
MNIYDRPKIDGHCHILDPQRFPYPSEVPYHPQGQEIGTANYYKHVMDAYGVKHALLVGPNSGYGSDNRCLLDAISQGEGRFKGMAVVSADTSLRMLKALKAQGIVGIAFNMALHGLDHYADIDPLLQLLRDLDMWAQFQVSANQLEALWPRIQRAGIQTMIDHCGRPILSEGPTAPGIEALWRLADSGLGVIKISGFAKFSEKGFPFDDTHEHVLKVFNAFGSDRCIWASDWPHLRGTYRLDYGTLLMLANRWFTPLQLQAMMWDTPAKILGW